MQIAALDKPESKRQNALLARKQAEEISEKKAAEKAAEEAEKMNEMTMMEFEETSEEVHVEIEDSTKDTILNVMKKRNTVDITGLASTALR